MLSTYGAKFNLVLVFILYYFVSAAGAVQEGNTSITIFLNKKYEANNREIYGEFINMQNYSTIKVNFNELPAVTNITFLVFQVHSFVNKITLYQNKKSYTTEVSGTNVGMVSVIKGEENAEPKITDVYYIENMNDANVQVYISVHVYEKTDPYPGGCNIEFQVDIAPYMILETKDDYMTIDAAVASTDAKCIVTEDGLTKFYMMYLPEMSFDEKEYFDGLRKMMTQDKIEEYGILLPSLQPFLEMRRTLSAYPSTGVIVVAVAKKYGYSVYVPNHSYGCPNLDKNGCNPSHNVYIQALCLGLVLIGLFLTFFGHRFFKTNMFLSGFFSGLILSYILIRIISGMDLDTNALISASILSGIIFGATWLLFWWLYGIPVVAVLLPSLNLGFLLASIFFYRVPPLELISKEELNFWSLFNFLALLTAMALVSMTYSASILCCAVLGAFATIFGLDYCVESNLKYIIINIIRRAVVPRFQYAVLTPPFQWRGLHYTKNHVVYTAVRVEDGSRISNNAALDTEMVMTLLWVTLAMFGWMYQHWHNRGRPPFPPPPRNTRLAAPRTTIGYGTVTNNQTPIRQEPRSIFDTFRASIPFGNYWVGQPANNERTPLITDA